MSYNYISVILQSRCTLTSYHNIPKCFPKRSSPILQIWKQSTEKLSNLSKRTSKGVPKISRLGLLTASPLHNTIFFCNREINLENAKIQAICNKSPHITVLWNVNWGVNTRDYAFHLIVFLNGSSIYPKALSRVVAINFPGLNFTRKKDVLFCVGWHVVNSSKSNGSSKRKLRYYWTFASQCLSCPVSKNILFSELTRQDPTFSLVWEVPLSAHLPPAALLRFQPFAKKTNLKKGCSEQQLNILHCAKAALETLTNKNRLK